MFDENPFAVDLCLRFLECSVHTLLHTRQIYPEALFEQRKYLGITCWQSRHPQINEYISKVIGNTKDIFKLGLFDRLIFTTVDSIGNTIDQTSITCTGAKSSNLTINSNIGSMNNHAKNTSHPFSPEFLDILEEEMRSSILKMTLLDGKLKKLSQDITWHLMVITKNITNKNQEDIMRQTISSKQWISDSEKLAQVNGTIPNRTSNSNANNSSSNSISSNLFNSTPSQQTPLSNNSPNNQNQTKLGSVVQVSSFHSDLIDLGVQIKTF